MAFDYYFVSVTGQYSEDLLVRLNANCLLSYLIDKHLIKKFLIRKKSGEWKGKLLIDNGAYTVWKKGGVIDIDEYLSFLNENIEYINYAISLDKIPGMYQKQKVYSDIVNAAEETYSNYIYMKERIKDPNKLLPVFHQDEPFEYLERYLEFDDIEYICIAAHDMNTRHDWYRDCFSIIKHSKHPNIKVHCLGNSLPEIVDYFPFTSIDASSWKLMGATGNILTSSGIVYVGTQHAIDTLPEKVKNEIISRCKECGVECINELAEKYSSRALYIMYQLHSISLNANVTQREFNEQMRLF